MDNKLKLETQLSWEDLRGFNLYVLYSRWWIILITILGVFMLLSVILHYTQIASIYPYPPTTQIFLGLLFTVFLPVFTIWSAWKQYNSNRRFNEKITYLLDTVWIEVMGESFETKLTWEKIYKVRETKNWFLIYSNKNMANIIPKNSLNQEQILATRNLIKSIDDLDFK